MKLESVHAYLTERNRPPKNSSSQILLPDPCLFRSTNLSYESFEPLYMARFIILQDKEGDPTNLLYISGAILIVALATVVIRFRNSKFLNLDKSKSNEL